LFIVFLASMFSAAPAQEIDASLRRGDCFDSTQSWPGANVDASRIVILCAVIVAVPVILSTITTFVRNQPKLSTLLATASINTPGRTTIAEPAQQQSTPRQAKLADLQEAGAPERAAPEEPLVVDHPPEGVTVRTERAADG
jgi:hypothetical protein